MAKQTIRTSLSSPSSDMSRRISIMEERMALKFLRIARASLLYTVIVFSVCTSITLIRNQEILMLVFLGYIYFFYIAVTASSLYFGYWLTRRHCKHFGEFLIACLIHTVLSTLALLCTLYVFFFLIDSKDTSGGSSIFLTLKFFLFSEQKFAFVSPISFFLGGGFYWLYHRTEDDT